MFASIIIPTYNKANLIIRSLETLTKQSLPASDFEVIVVDNNSTDNTASKVKGFIADLPNFNYVLEPKTGATNARHSGARLAKSDILIFCDDDGLYNDKFIEEVLRVYRQNDSVAAVTGKIDLLWDKKAPEWIAPYEFMLGKLNYGNEIIYRKDLYLNGGIFSVKKDIFMKLKGFNPDLVGEYLIGDGDTGLVIKLHKAGFLIGYTPFATMQHLQFVDKHGTEKDLGRRFYNTGISSSYGIFRENRFRFGFSEFQFLFKSLIFFIKKGIENFASGRNNKKLYFSYMQRKGELAFFLLFRKKSIRQLLNQENL